MSNPTYNLVIHDRNWVMEKIATHVQKYLPNSKLSEKTDLDADINFYFNWHGMKQKTNFDVCFFTHIEKGAENYWNMVGRNCDVAVTMCQKYFVTVPQDKAVLFKIPPFENFLPQKPIKILICGRAYNSGRKNFEAARALKGMPNVELTFTEGKLSESSLKKAYEDTDYVLVTSKIEGGPMCVVEALAMNKPVIAPDVGWCWEFPVIRYQNEEHLKNIIENISFPNTIWKDTVSKLNRDIYEIFNSRS